MGAPLYFFLWPIAYSEQADLDRDMIIMRIKALTAALVLGLAACGGGDTDEPPPSSAPSAQPPAASSGVLTVPFWMQVDNSAQTVAIRLVAGETAENNRWNFNGHHGGIGGITVPVGYTVTVSLENQDPAMGHSVGVDRKAESYPNLFTEVAPAFEGGVTPDPTSMTDSTMPGETDEITFLAGEAGDYVLMCYVVGHAAIGMWIDFTVSANGDVGAQM